MKNCGLWNNEKMDFSFKDDEMAGPNMQHKRLFDGAADVDSNSMKLLVN